MSSTNQHRSFPVDDFNCSITVGNDLLYSSEAMVTCETEYYFLKDDFVGPIDYNILTVNEQPSNCIYCSIALFGYQLAGIDNLVCQTAYETCLRLCQSPE